MRCNQCGKEIQDNSVFCPFCGVPQKVTADYDYIQSEIGANVDKIKSTGDTVEIKGHKNGDTANVPNASKRKEELMKTRNVYGNDTIYSEDGEEYSEDYDDEYEEYDDEYEDEYDDDYEDDYDRHYSPKKSKTRHVDDDYFYNSFDDLDDYEKESGGNKGIIITTVIIVIICILGIAGIIYFGLKPQDKTSQDNQTVTTQAADNSQTTAESTDDTATAAETTTAVSEAASKESVFNYLVENNVMSSDYKTSDGGFIDLTVSGTAKIDEGVYYIIQADYYDSSNNLKETTYYGVDTATGDLYKVERDGAEFKIV